MHAQAVCVTGDYGAAASLEECAIETKQYKHSFLCRHLRCPEFANMRSAHRSAVHAVNLYVALETPTQTFIVHSLSRYFTAIPSLWIGRTGDPLSLSTVSATTYDLAAACFGQASLWLSLFTTNKLSDIAACT